MHGHRTSRPTTSTGLPRQGAPGPAVRGPRRCAGERSTDRGTARWAPDQRLPGRLRYRRRDRADGAPCARARRFTTLMPLKIERGLQPVSRPQRRRTLARAGLGQEPMRRQHGAGGRASGAGALGGGRYSGWRALCRWPEESEREGACGFMAAAAADDETRAPPPLFPFGVSGAAELRSRRRRPLRQVWRKPAALDLFRPKLSLRPQLGWDPQGSTAPEGPARRRVGGGGWRAGETEVCRGSGRERGGTRGAGGRAGAAGPQTRGGQRRDRQPRRQDRRRGRGE